MNELDRWIERQNRMLEDFSPFLGPCDIFYSLCGYLTCLSNLCDFANSQPANEVKLWVAADEDGAMMAFTEPPIRFYGMEHYWKGIGRRRWPSKLFGFTPVMTWKDSPRRVTVRVTIGGTS